MSLRDEIAELLRMPEHGVGAPSLDTIESTLTDGYAGKPAGRREFARLSEQLETIDGELAKLRPLLHNLQARRRLARRAA